MENLLCFKRILDIVGDSNAIAIDIGSFRGGYTNLMKDYFNKIFIYEPFFESYKFLIKRFSKIKKVKVNNYGLFNKECKKTLYTPYIKNITTGNENFEPAWSSLCKDYKEYIKKYPDILKKVKKLYYTNESN